MVRVPFLVLPTRPTRTVVEQFLLLVGLHVLVLLGLLLPLIILLLLLLVLGESLEVLEPREVYVTSLSMSDLFSATQLSRLNIPI